MISRYALVTCLAWMALAEEEAEQVSSESVAIAATLLGAISFQMSIFYLTNHSDSDMRRYTYEVISATISIFCAVLLFQSGNDLLEAVLFEGTSAEFQLLVDLLHMIFWYCALQLTLAVTSGAIGELIGWPQASLESVESNIKCWAVLLAHMTGFASINFWSGMQQLPFFRSSPAMCLWTLPISAVCQFGLQQVSDRIRLKVSLADDGEEDDYEKLWSRETADSENDVMGLTLSFQMVQCARFLICGHLPNQEGEEPWPVLIGHTGNQARELLVVAAFCVAVVFALIITMREDRTEKVKRATETMITTFSMCFAWSVFFGFDWYMGSFNMVGNDEMLLSVLLAMVLSVLSFTAIRILDKIVDAELTDGRVDEAVKQLIGAIGILVGFAWEQCFDHATLSLSNAMPMRHLCKLLLAGFCAVILVPAWRWYILPMVVAEGWRFGFVIDPDHNNWMDLINHERFEDVLQRLLTQHDEERRSSVASVDLGSTTERLGTLKSLRRASEAPEESSCYNQLPGSEIEEGRSKDAQLADLRKKNAQLEAALAQVLKSYTSHMDVIQGSLGRIQKSVNVGRLPPSMGHVV